MGDMKIVEFLEDIGLLIKDIMKMKQNKKQKQVKEQKIQKYLDEE